MSTVQLTNNNSNNGNGGSSCSSRSSTAVSKTPSPDCKQQQSDFVPNIFVAQKQGPKCCTAVLTVFVLCLINTLNYVNHFTAPAIYSRLKDAFGSTLSDSQLGSIQTWFEIVYVIASPILGFLGDRFPRKYILIASLLIANISGLASSFATNYYMFVAFRALLAMGESAYTNIAPVIIADMFVGKMRTLVFALFQFAIPVGCGLGYIAGTYVAELTQDWRWALRLTPAPLLVAIVFSFFFVPEPKRGAAENAVASDSKTSFVADVKWLLKVPSFVIACFAFIGVAFAIQALSLWTPFIMDIKIDIMTGAKRTAEIGLIFGAITILSGIVGVVLGTLVSNHLLKPKLGPAADGIVCGISMLGAAPMIFFAMEYIHNYNMTAAWILIFFGVTLLCCNWVLVSEMTMNVVVPTRRATATTLMAAVGHLLGNAASPYLVGKLSDLLRATWTPIRSLESSSIGSTTTTEVNRQADFFSMKYSLYMSLFVIVLTGGLFLFGSLFLNEDTAKAKAESSGKPRSCVETPDSPSNNDLEKSPPSFYEL